MPLPLLKQSESRSNEVIKPQHRAALPRSTDNTRRVVLRWPGTAMDVAARCGDRWWFATVLLYAPRWLYGLPLIVLVPLAAWGNRRALLPLVAATVVFISPRDGPSRSACTKHCNRQTPAARSTCNMQGGKVARNALAEFAVNEQADIVRSRSATETLSCPGRRVGTCYGRADWLSHRGSTARCGPLASCPSAIPMAAAQRPTMRRRGTLGRFRVLLRPLAYTAQLVSSGYSIRGNRRAGRSRLLNELIQCRRWESEELKQWIANSNRPTIIAGDFNMPVDSTIYRDVWSSFANAFDAAGFGFGNTKITSKRGWSYGCGSIRFSTATPFLAAANVGWVPMWALTIFR